MHINFNRGNCNALASNADIDHKLEGIPAVPPDATPWQQIYRRTVTQLVDGAVIEDAVAFRGIAQKGHPRHNH